MVQLQENTGSWYRDGVYEGKDRAYDGFVRVKVTVQSDQIATVDIISHQEDEPYWQNALVTVDRILQQDTKVDNVAGSTKSRKGSRRAVKDALKKAEIE